MKNLFLITLCLLLLGTNVYGQIYGGDYALGCPIGNLDCLIMGNPTDIGHADECRRAILSADPEAKVAYIPINWYDAVALAESSGVCLVAPIGSAEIMAFYHVPKMVKKESDVLCFVSITSNGGSDTQKIWTSNPSDTSHYGVCVTVGSLEGSVLGSCGPNVDFVDYWGGAGGNRRSYVLSRTAGRLSFIRRQIGKWTGMKATWHEAKKIARMLAGSGSVDSLGRRESFGGVIDIMPSKIDSVLRTIYGAPIVGSNPVELSSFQVWIIAGGVFLEWTTASETNNLGFAVERKSSNKNEWQEIGFVQGAGTVAMPRQYFYQDTPDFIGSVSYRLRQVDTDGSFSYSQVVEVIVQTHLQFALAQNFPNPFNPVTTIRYSLPSDGNAKMIIFDMLGKEVVVLVNDFQVAGEHYIIWNAGQLASGSYFYRLESNGRVLLQKMTLLK